MTFQEVLKVREPVKQDVSMSEKKTLIYQDEYMGEGVEVP